MQLPTRTKMILMDDTTKRYFPMTDWMPGIHAKEANMLILLRQVTGTTGLKISPAIQFAATDPDSPQPWEGLQDSATLDEIDTAGTRIATNFVDVTGSGYITSGTDDYFWVRFGVSAKCEGPERGEVEVTVGVRS